MIKYLLPPLAVLLILLNSCTSKTDNLETAANDSIKKYLGLAENNSLDSYLVNKYSNKALSFINLNKNDSLTRFYLNVLSYNYMRTQNKRLLKNIGKIHFEMSLAAKDTLNLARYYRYKAGYLKNTSVYDSSLYYYLKAEKLYKKTNDEKGLAIVYRNKSQIQFDFDDYLGANFSSSKAYTYFKKTNRFREQVHVLIVMGNTNTVLKDYKTAIYNFEIALEIIKTNNLDDLTATCLNNLGNTYREQKKFNKAIYYFNLALKQKDLIKNDPATVGFLLNNLSYCKLQLKNYSGVPAMLFKSIKLFNIDNQSESIKESSISYIYLSNYYISKADTLKSQLFAEKALYIAKHSNAPYYYLTALSNAGTVNKKNASKYIQEYHRIHDSLFYADNNTKYQYYKIQLETNDIKQEKENAIKQKWIIGIISSIMIVIIILLLIITKQRSRQKELKLLQSQQKVNEDIYNLMLNQKNKEDQIRQSEKKRIALELHDGVMNRLASTRLNLNILHHKRDRQTIEECLIYIDGIYKIEKEIRSIAHNLTIEIFNSNDSFIILIDDFLITQNRTFNAKYKLEMDQSINWDAISGNIKMNFYRIIQEASHNVNKFSQAKNVMITFIQDKKNICLSITDDGKGFNPEETTEGIGLKNMKQRVETLKGKFIIQSIKGKSTSLNIAIPFA